MSNPYAPPRAAVQDIADPDGGSVAADRGARLGASILDAFIFAAMVYAPFLAGAILGGVLGSTADNGSAGVMTVGGGAALALVGLVVWSWLTISYVKRNGQSIGKKLLGIKVVRRDGAPITLGRLFWLRNFVNAVIHVIPFYGFLDALFIFGESRQCLHDRIADTIVVKA